MTDPVAHNARAAVPLLIALLRPFVEDGIKRIIRLTDQRSDHKLPLATT